jgi:ABC-type nickel/cobalt efflux system permease component RcnA
MSQGIRDRLSIRSPLSRGIAKIFFAAVVIASLSLISFSSSLDLTRLGALWCLGAVAVGLLVRSWRKERRQQCARVHRHGVRGA